MEKIYQNRVYYTYQSGDNIQRKPPMPLDAFRKSLETTELIADLRAGLIGEGMRFETPFGVKTLIYADYTASGRALRQVEDFIMQQVLPCYANSHTEASFCGAYTSHLREDARRVIARHTHAGAECSVIFTGPGATSAINRLVALSGVAQTARTSRPAVFIGPYEHHSNILPWRESGAEIIEIGEAPAGGPDLAELEAELQARKDRPLLIGSFSAASNVTGIITDADAVTGLLKRYGALAFWDYAGAGPYLPIDMNPGAGLEKDAVFLSPHKFPGGPGASGVLVVRNSAVHAHNPTWPGGGSVSYVSPWGHNYLSSITEREEAGTPNIIGDIRAALVFLIKDAVGAEYIAARDHELGQRALKLWRNNPKLVLLGTDKPNRLPIFSFDIRDGEGSTVHHQLFTRMLSDITGIQARGGCVCAGPYGHRLLGVDREHSERIRRAILAGHEIEKPGWVRLNFSYLMDDETANYIIRSVDDLALNAARYAGKYTADETHASFCLPTGDALNCAAST
jgi:selenocysteine lyase/cysteine desulfurase